VTSAKSVECREGENGPQVGLVTMDEKGRVVIPRKVRRKAGINGKQVLLVIGRKNVVFIKRVDLAEPYCSDATSTLALMSLQPVGRPRTARELIVWSLGNQPVLTFRRIRNFIRRSRGRISYQGMWKALRDLRNEGVVSRLGGSEYTLNREWLRGVRSFVDAIEQRQQPLDLADGSEG
jgi:bifunctional DNA-binding transcriptional regulator/antitoxin component of YhaV-PrlF toxin-antitoxin module